MYIARIKNNGKVRFVLRESVRDRDVFVFRDLFDLGGDPSRFVRYPGGNAFYVDTGICDSVREMGADPEALEDVFWPFIRPDIRRAVETFRRRRHRTAGSPKEKQGFLPHILDRRRVYYLRFGGLHSRTLAKAPATLFQVLCHKSRDEIEQHLMAQEQLLRPRELKKYVFDILDLAGDLNRFMAEHTPDAIRPEEMDAVFEKRICRLNEDNVFWAGVHKGDSLHPYLFRYVIMYYDQEFAHSTMAEDFVRGFMNRNRRHRAVMDTGGVGKKEAALLLGVSRADLAGYTRTQLARAYRRAATRLHPDKGGDKEAFIRLSRWYRKAIRTKRDP